MTSSRLLEEMENIRTNAPDFGSAGPADEDIFHWQATIFGPPGSPFEGGIFNLNIDFPENYPLRSPEVVFKTQIYHPNINSNGAIGLDILGTDWNPSITISEVLLAIYLLLSEPNLTAPLVPKIARQYEEDNDLYFETAREWTEMYAM